MTSDLLGPPRECETSIPMHNRALDGAFGGHINVDGLVSQPIAIVHILVLVDAPILNWTITKSDERFSRLAVSSTLKLASR